MGPVKNYRGMVRAAGTFTRLGSFRALSSGKVISHSHHARKRVTCLHRRRVCIPGITRIRGLLVLRPIVGAITTHLVGSPRRIFDRIGRGIVGLFLGSLRDRILLRTHRHMRGGLRATLGQGVDAISRLARRIRDVRGAMRMSRVCTKVGRGFVQFTRAKSCGGVLHICGRGKVLPRSRLYGCYNVDGGRDCLGLILSVLGRGGRSTVIVQASVGRYLKAWGDFPG